MSRFADHLQWIDTQHEQMIDLLQRWAAINTGSHNVGGLEAFAKQLLPTLSQLSPQIDQIALPPRMTIADDGRSESQPLGKALSFRSPIRSGPRILLAIHYDTVFAPDHLFQSVSRISQNTLRGPGVCDAKGGLLVLLFALLALERSPFASGLSWEVLLNPDEEISSPGSSPLFTQAAQRNDIGLVFEPALPDGALVSSRKGSGNFTLIVRGRSAHAGRDIHLGRNAIHALAALITKIAALQEDLSGIGINTGSIHGGGPINIVPDFALARMNVRAETLQQQTMFEIKLREILAQASQTEGITIECHGEFHCPPKPLTPATERLLANLKECATELALPLAWRSTGGVCDGNRLAAAGLPTVDSLGVRGGNMHTDQEFVHLNSLTERAKLVALFLMRLAAGEITIDRSSSPRQAEVLQR